jgi:regulator of cell morphogenesis and NO signaling
MDRSADNSGASLDVMCHDIVGRHHASVFRLLPRVGDELASFSPTPALSEVRMAFASVADQVRGHLAKEEHLLFPSFVALATAEREGTRPALPFSTVLHPIRMMEAEHVRIEAALDRLRSAALAVPEPDSLSPEWHRLVAELSELDTDLREQHRTENEILFPWALELERQLL